MALSSSLTKSYAESPNHSRRLISSSGSRTKVELHQVDVQLQKEIDRLERQQNAAVNNIANHQQAMKMSWRRLEQKRAAESPPKSSTKELTSSPVPRRGIFHSNTKLNSGANVWKPEAAPPPLGANEGTSPLVVTVAGDVHHRRVARGPPPSSSNRMVSSPYLSSPYNMRRPIQTPLPSKLSSGSGVLSSSSSSQTGGVGNVDVSDKDTLLRASKLMGVESSASQGPQSFKEFYSSSGTVDRSSSAASVLVSNAMEQSLSASQFKAQKSRGDDGNDENPESALPPDGEMTMAQMFDQIKHCRYIRRYHPDGTALEEYLA